ncbi:MAG: ATP-binding protein [Paludibacteraceae bacterium]|nr:ATP-binding protein [Paludibacteraceae bacterium]
MGKTISNKNVLNARFNVAEFEGEWLASFGRPELRGSWIVWGGSGSGKTTFMLQLAKYVSQFRKVAYNSLEQGLCLSFQVAWNRVGMADAGNNIMLIEKETLADLRLRLDKKRSPDIIIVDSLHYWQGFKLCDYVNLLQSYPDKLFVFVSHERNGEPKGSIAQYIRYNSDVKIRVEGYKAFITTRYEDKENGVGGADYTIWEEGANEYNLTKM